METLFKKGDEVICLDNKGFEEVLTIGKAYKVLDVDYNLEFMVLINGSSTIGGWFINNLKLYQES